MERSTPSDLQAIAKEIQTTSTNGLDVEQRPCDRCGRIIHAVPRSLHDQTKGFWWPKCICITGDLESEWEAKKHQEEQSRYDKVYRVFDLPDRFQDRRIETFIPDKGSEEAFQTVKRYIETLSARLEEGAGYCLYGPNGNGKTHLAASSYHSARQHGLPVVFVPVPELLRRFKDSYNKGKSKEKEAVLTENALMTPLCNAKLLILDDLGQETPTDWVRQQLFIIINTRYEARRSTIVTTNRYPSELSERIGKASFDRLTEMCQFFEITSESKRFDQAPLW